MYPLELYPGPTIPSLTLPGIGRLWPSGDDDDPPSCLDYFSHLPVRDPSLSVPRTCPGAGFFYHLSGKYTELWLFWRNFRFLKKIFVFSLEELGTVCSKALRHPLLDNNRVKRTCCLVMIRTPLCYMSLFSGLIYRWCCNFSQEQCEDLRITIMLMVIILTTKDLRRPKFSPAWGRAAVGEGQTAVPCHHVPEPRLLSLSSSSLSSSSRKIK